MPNTEQHGSGKVIHPELTEPIIGLAFNVFRELGFGLQERYYQRAFAEELRKAGIPFRKEQYIPIMYEKRVIGRCFVDFVINRQVVVDWKIANEFYESQINQVLGYMRSTGIKYGLITRVTPTGVKVKRLVL